MTAAAPIITTVAHRDMANAIRFLAADAVEKAKSGHPGMPHGHGRRGHGAVHPLPQVRRRPTPRWADRDRFVLSAGHGSMLLYAIAYLTGYVDIDIEQIKNFRQLGSRTPGHPEYGHVAIAETTTGPLGQGLANAVGMALAEKLLAARFGSELVRPPHLCHRRRRLPDGRGSARRRFRWPVITGCAKLIVLWDDNHISIDGDTALATSDDQLAAFRGLGLERLPRRRPRARSRGRGHRRRPAPPTGRP